MDEKWHQHGIMVVIVRELHNSWKAIVVTKLQLSCNELHPIYGELQLITTCPITLIVYKYGDLQMPNASQKFELQG
jgi:hypothetical protein